MADSTNQIDIAVSNNVDPQIAPRLISIADASDKAEKSVGNLKSQLARLHSGSLSGQLGSDSAAAQMLSAQTDRLVGSMSTLTALIDRVTASTAKKIVSDGAGAAATKGLVSANVSAAASLGILEGRTLSMNRAAANFATRVLGLGSILQAAFPIIGAIAMVDVLYQMGSSLAKTYEQAKNAGSEIAKAFDSSIVSLSKTNDELALTNDKLDATITKLEHRPTTNGAVMALDEARVMADKLDDSLDRVQRDLDGILKKNSIDVFQSLLTGNATTGSTEKFIQDQYDNIKKAQDAARTALDTAATNSDPKAAHSAMLTAYQNERKAIQDVVTALEEKYNAEKKVSEAPSRTYANCKRSKAAVRRKLPSV